MLRVLSDMHSPEVWKCSQRDENASAPPPDKLIPKSNLDVSLWVLILEHKFEFFQPLHRILAEMRSRDLDLAAGTITDGLQKLVPSSSRSTVCSEYSRRRPLALRQAARVPKKTIESPKKRIELPKSSN